MERRDTPTATRRSRAAQARRRSRARVVAAAGIVVALVVAAAVTARTSGAPAALPEVVPPAAPVVANATAALRSRIAHARGCVDRSASVPAVHCVVGGVALDVWMFGPGADEAYRRRVGRPVGVRTGAPRCERGRPDERSWSRPVAPSLAVGRYRCRLERGRAAIWWTDHDDGLLAHAVAPHADLARLFSWWRAHPFE